MLSVDFSYDSRLILTGTEDGTAQFWHVGMGKTIGPPLQHNGKVVTVAFSFDGVRAVTGCEGDNARIWKTPVPLPGDATKIIEWIEYATGMELDTTGAVRFLPVGDWQKRAKPTEFPG